jgi:hypothetical protein
MLKELTVSLLLPAAGLAQATNPSPAPFELKAGQSVYVVAMDTSSRANNLTSGSLELERKAREQFERLKKFKVATSLPAADFVFIALLDRDSPDTDEVALAVPAAAYLANKDSIDKLRDAAIWQGLAHITKKKRAAGLLPGVAMYQAVSQPSLVKDLVKKFHKEALASR